MKFFDLIFVATNGGPNEASTVVGLRIYWHSMREGRFNHAATMSARIIDFMGRFTFRYDMIAATTVILFTPILVLYLITQRSFHRGIAIWRAQRLNQAEAKHHARHLRRDSSQGECGSR